MTRIADDYIYLAPENIQVDDVDPDNPFEMVKNLTMNA